LREMHRYKEEIEQVYGSIISLIIDTDLIILNKISQYARKRREVWLTDLESLANVKLTGLVDITCVICPQVCK
jgi:hypothetical protein